jgi:outer membrane protein assembly factor BamA
LSLLAFLALSIFPATAQEPARANAPQMGKIASLRVTGARRYSETQIIAAGGLRVGDTVTRDDIEAATNRLLQIGVFSEVRYVFSSIGDNIDLQFQVQEAPTVPVSFDNFPWFTDEELTNALREVVSLFNDTAPEQGAILDTMAERLQKLLAEHNIRGTIEHTLVARPASDGVMQQFRLVGPSLKIEAVQFSDALASESPRIKERLSDIVGTPYSRFAIEVFANEQVKPAYLERGYLRVRFGRPSARFTGAPNRPLPDRVLVILPIEPGAAYHWAGVEWRGNMALDTSTLDGLVPVKANEIADGVKIAGLWLRVQDEYGRRGYLDAKVEPEAVFYGAAQRVSYRVTIQGGVQYRMCELVITGLSPTGEHRLLDAWRMPRGQIFDRLYFDDFLHNIKQVFANTPIHFDEVGHWLRTDPQKRLVDVLLDFR